jgi:hypothetical protein
MAEVHSRERRAPAEMKRRGPLACSKKRQLQRPDNPGIEGRHPLLSNSPIRLQIGSTGAEGIDLQVRAPSDRRHADTIQSVSALSLRIGARESPARRSPAPRRPAEQGTLAQGGRACWFFLEKSRFFGDHTRSSATVSACADRVSGAGQKDCSSRARSLFGHSRGWLR